MPGDDSEGGEADGGFVEAAWPIDPLPDSNLGEMLAIAKSLAVAIQQVRDHRAGLMGKRVNVTIFSDSNSSLRVLDGDKINKWLWKLVLPAASFIRTQSQLLGQLGPTVHLVLRWMPGHRHDIFPHVPADSLSRMLG